MGYKRKSGMFHMGGVRVYGYSIVGIHKVQLGLGMFQREPKVGTTAVWVGTTVDHKKMTKL